MEQEAKKKIKVFMGIPSTGDRLDGQVYFLRRMERMYGDQIEFIYPEIYVGRIFHDCARNAYVEQFLASDADVLWFLDADILPPERLLELITVHWDKWKCAGAPYPVWMSQPGYEGPQVVFTVYRKQEGDEDNLYPKEIPYTGTGFVEGVATGCIFIKREVLEKMQKPYFEFKYNPETREMTQGEDLGFCLKTLKLGYTFFIDYTMLCGHFKKVNLLDVSNFVEFQKGMIVDNCDRMIRQIVAKKQLEKLNKPKPQIEVPKTKLILPTDYNK